MKPKRSPDKVEVRSVGQSGGVTAHTINVLQPAQSIWAKWQTKVALVAGVVAILTYFGLKPNSSNPQTSPTAMLDKSSSVKSENQHGGITAGSIGAVNINTMQPQVEGLRASWEQVPSPWDDAPYAMRVTLQVAAPVQPFGFAVITDTEIAHGKFEQVGNSAYMGAFEGFLNDHPKNSYMAGFKFPAVTPSSPVIVTVACRSSFRLVNVARVNP